MKVELNRSEIKDIAELLYLNAKPKMQRGTLTYCPKGTVGYESARKDMELVKKLEEKLGEELYESRVTRLLRWR